jgi:poly-gamma-glutamate biosynthesis protein PgsC/CapC
MDPVTISIGTGLVVSLGLTELFGLAAGGMVVPGYLALFLDRPIIVILTLAAAYLTWAIVKGLSRVAIIYGKRRTAMMILVGFLIGFACRFLLQWMGSTHENFHAADFQIIGFIIPGLMAIWIERQGLLETCCVVLTASALVRLVLTVCGLEVLA